jgi:hypothetical protein
MKNILIILFNLIYLSSFPQALPYINGDTIGFIYNSNEYNYKVYGLNGILDFNYNGISVATIDSSGNFSIDGEITTTNVYNDISVSGTSFGAGAKAPSLMAFVGGIQRYGFNYQTQDDEVSFEVQLDHEWIENDTAHFHIHYSPATTPIAGDTIVIGFEYAFATIDSVMSSPNYHTSDTILIEIPINGKVINGHYVQDIANIALPECKVSTIIICRLFRQQSNSSDTYENFVFIAFADFHYKVNGLGSNTEWIK